MDNVDATAEVISVILLNQGFWGGWFDADVSSQRFECSQSTKSLHLSCWDFAMGGWMICKAFGWPSWPEMQCLMVSCRQVHYLCIERAWNWSLTCIRFHIVNWCNVEISLSSLSFPQRSLYFSSTTPQLPNTHLQLGGVLTVTTSSPQSLPSK